MVKKLNNSYSKKTKNKINQGDILKDFSLLYTMGEYNSSIDFPYCVVLTQDCDITQHYKNLENKKNSDEEIINDDKILNTILLCPSYPLDGFVLGIHIDDMSMRSFSVNEIKKLKNNEEYNRYHFIEGSDIFPDLVLDFKRFYTVPIEFIEDKFTESYLVSFNDLFKERVSQRFANYLSRIGLPDVNDLLLD